MRIYKSPSALSARRQSFIVGAMEGEVDGKRPELRRSMRAFFETTIPAVTAAAIETSTAITTAIVWNGFKG
jgi:hypothetical protein